MPTLHVRLLGDYNLVYDGAPLTSFFHGHLQAPFTLDVVDTIVC